MALAALEIYFPVPGGLSGSAAFLLIINIPESGWQSAHPPQENGAFLSSDVFLLTRHTQLRRPPGDSISAPRSCQHKAEPFL